MGRTRGGSSGSGGTNLGTAYASVKIDHSGVTAGMDAALNAVRGGVSAISGALESTGRQISNVGSALTQTFTPMAGVLGLATKSAMDFDETMANIGAVLGKTAPEMETIREQVLGIGTDSRYGGQEAAMAFYDIVGGVADATTHMAILEAAVATAQAGNAELTGTTSALISVMNSYGYEADQAAFASDVLTQIVGKGVGTMDQFASALPLVAGTAASVGIEFDQLGSNIAFLTTKGFSASQSATRLNSAISSLLTPNAAMIKAFEKAGIESGSLALEQDGLATTLDKVFDALGGDKDAFAKALGSQEALQAAVHLTNEEYAAFEETFVTTTEGVTAAAEAIQLDSAAADFDMLKSEVEGLGIEVGSALIPVLRDLIKQVRPVIKQIIDWVKENPELVKQIGTIVIALGTLGPILAVVGAAISGIGALIGALSSPIVLIVGALAGLYYAFQENIGGIRDILQPVFDQISTTINDVVLPALNQLYTWFVEDALPAIVSFIETVVIPAVETFTGILIDIWNMVAPGLTQLANWFITEALPAVVGFIQGTVIPAMQQLVGFIQKLWTDVQPFLQQMYDWFVTSALPAVVNFIETIVVPVVQKFIDILTSIWETVGPVLQSLYDWFITNGLPFIVEFMNNVVTPLFNDFISTLSSIWTVVSPFIDAFVTGIQTAFNIIKDVVITPLIGVIDGLLKILQGIWDAVQGPVNAFKDNLRIVFDGIREFIDSVIQRVNEFIGTLEKVGEFMANLDQTGKGAGGLFGSGIGPDFDPLGGIRNIGRDQGGRGLPGNIYAIGTGAQPEMFIPDSAGSFYPRDQWMGQGGMGGSTDNSVNVQTVVIQANSYEEGAAAADGFNARMKEIRRSRG